MKNIPESLHFSKLTSLIKKEFEKIKDPIKKRRKYTLTETLCSMFSVFYFKYPSLLEFEEQKNNEPKIQNIKNILEIRNVPSDTHARVILDDIDYENRFQYCFDKVITQLDRSKKLHDFQMLDGYYILAIDGTQYYESNNISCNNCCVKKHKNGTIEYYHQVLAAVICHREISQVFPLAIEQIVKQDGATKNDCEVNALKRLLPNIRKSHPNMKIIVTLDALYANAPVINLLNELNFKFVITEKNNTYLSKNFEASNNETVQNKKKEVLQTYKFANDLSLNANNKEVKVNYLQYTEHTQEKEEISVKYKSDWVTNIKLNVAIIDIIMKIGRSRWKVENETFNTLKNQGYNLEHNYGHGKNNLSVILCYLMFLAFLVEQVQLYANETLIQAFNGFSSKRLSYQRQRFLLDCVELKDLDQLYDYLYKISIGDFKIKINTS